jgi:hypothetical protein
MLNSTNFSFILLGSERKKPILNKINTEWEKKRKNLSSMSTAQKIIENSKNKNY